MLNFCLREAPKLITRTMTATLLYCSLLKYDELVSLCVCLSLHFCLTCGLQNGHLDVVKFLVEKGADVHHADNDEVTPLWVASEVCF